jgi:DNA polymerase-3 subunit alpha/error-prone DNA polymerase
MREEPCSRGTELFGDPSAGTELKNPRRQIAMPEHKRLESQMRYLGTTLDSHPLALYPQALKRSRTLGKDLSKLAGCRVELAGWPITAKPVLTSAEEPMEFVSFEDETSLYEAVLFPDAYRRYRFLLHDGKPLWVRGRIEEDRGAAVLYVESLAVMERSVPRWGNHFPLP